MHLLYIRTFITFIINDREGLGRGWDAVVKGGWVGGGVDLGGGRVGLGRVGKGGWSPVSHHRLRGQLHPQRLLLVVQCLVVHRLVSGVAADGLQWQQSIHEGDDRYASGGGWAGGWVT